MHVFSPEAAEHTMPGSHSGGLGEKTSVGALRILHKPPKADTGISGYQGTLVSFLAGCEDESV